MAVQTIAENISRVRGKTKKSWATTNKTTVNKRPGDRIAKITARKKVKAAKTTRYTTKRLRRLETVEMRASPVRKFQAARLEKKRQSRT